MPIYEYEPDDRDCLMCDGRIDVIQGIHEEALQFCPSCGLEVKRIVSRASFSMRMGVNPNKSAAQGFTTWQKTQKGVWEKVSGDGADVIAGTPEQMKEVAAESKPVTKLDFDK